MSSIPVHLAVEDELSEGVLRRLLQLSGRNFEICSVFRKNGYGYLRARIASWNQAAASIPILVLTDLDNRPCPVGLLQDWIPLNQHPNLILRVAVREVESWILADGSSFAKFLNCSPKSMPALPDELNHPKQHLIQVVRKSRARSIKDRVVPRNNSTATQGPDYNSCLLEYVMDFWNPTHAALRSPSLQRTINRIQVFTPVIRSW